MEIDKFFGWGLVKVENKHRDNNVCITLNNFNSIVVTAFNVDSFDMRGFSGVENVISKFSIFNDADDAGLCGSILYYVGLEKIEELTGRNIIFIEFDSGAKITCLCENFKLEVD